MILNFLIKLFDKPKPVVVSGKEALKLRLIANSNAIDKRQLTYNLSQYNIRL